MFYAVYAGKMLYQWDLNSGKSPTLRYDIGQQNSSTCTCTAMWSQKNSETESQGFLVSSVLSPFASKKVKLFVLLKVQIFSLRLYFLQMLTIGSINLGKFFLLYLKMSKICTILGIWTQKWRTASARH